MYRDVNNLIKKELIKPPYYVNFVLGMQYQGAIEATPETLVSMYQFLPENCLFNTTATCAAQLPVTTMGMIMGGCVRVGLEDNIYYSRGVLAQSNAQLVERSATDRQGAQPGAGHSGRGQADPGRGEDDSRRRRRPDHG